ncbi:DUF5103 domain-containing protein [soil metagenome]
MTVVKNSLIIFLFFLFALPAYSQTPDSIYYKNIRTVKLYNAGDQLSLPVLNLNSNDQAELHFDDLDADVKYYYYTYQLCNNDWQPVNLSEFDYIKGFTQNRITTYRTSSIAYVRYTHYQVTLPERNCTPSRSGNYLVKVFLDGDTSKLVFTKRLMILDNKAVIKAQVVQPYTPQYFRTHQKIQFNINITGLNSFNANQQVKVIILQNHRWDNAIKNIAPTFIRGSTLEYNTEETSVFPAGKEWRWLDIRDFHLQSDRVKSADYNRNSTEIYMQPDMDRAAQRYVYYRDLNGMYMVENTTGVNPYWQSDYADVHFYLKPSESFIDADVYLAGEMTNYKLTDSLKMKFNGDKGLYETNMLLKQGYYSYTYVAIDKNNPAKRYELEGNYFETENEYTILVYYRSFTGRADELIGVSKINSRTDNPGFSF